MQQSNPMNLIADIHQNSRYFMAGQNNWNTLLTFCPNDII